MAGSDQKQSTLPKYTFFKSYTYVNIYEQLEETCLNN